VLLFEGLYLPGFRFEIGIDFVLVGVIVRESRVNLGEREVSEFSRDFLRNQPHFVPRCDAAHRDAGAGDAWPAAANFGTPGDQAAYFCDHCLRLNYFIA